MTRVEVQDVSVRYGSVWAVREVTLEVQPGELFFLLGPSGCGKTTLLRAVAGLARPASGQVLFHGRPMNTVPPHERNVGFVFQNYALWPHLTVMENVEYGLVTRGVEKLQRRHRAETALAMMNLGGLGERYPGELSGGQQQRVAVARAVVVEPDVLLLDEPLSNLDARLRADMRVELKALARRLGVTTIYVTHDQREALSMADRVAVMKDGRVVQCAPPRQLYAKPRNEFVATFVGDANVFDGSVASAREGAVAVNVGERTFKAARSAEFAEGEPVRLLFRPEDVETGEDLEGENTFEARVTDVSFAGDREEVVLTDPKGRVVRAIRAPGAKPLELGEQTFARFPAASAHVFRVE